MLRTIFSVLLVAPLSYATAGDSLDFSKAWFKPHLIENNDPVCETVFRSVEEHFWTRAKWEGFPVHGLDQLEILESVAFPDEKAVHLTPHTHVGCGDACDTYQLLASREPRIVSDLWPSDAAFEAAPPAAMDYRLYKSGQGAIYLISTDIAQEPNRIAVHRLSSDAQWFAACKIAIAPDTLEKNVPDEVMAAVNRLESAVGRLSQGAGECGSMRTHWRWRADVGVNLRETLYRPWGQDETDAVNDDGRYELDVANLQLWTLTGLLEYRAFAAYERQLAETTVEMANFYQRSFGWPKERAQSVADKALKAAVSSGIRFYEYRPFFSEREKRKAILEKRSLDEIRALPEHVDDLSIAIEYPEAMRYLIEQGADVHQVNPFGKTLLMYAAHYNQLETAKLLLEQGVDPNATTILPKDRCYYTLTTSNMTALHYAVRYASPAFIELLLKSGADASIAAVTDRGKTTPIDWLRRYSGPEAVELNRNIPPSAVAELEQHLRASGHAP